jgi:hypothetical protein
MVPVPTNKVKYIPDSFMTGPFYSKCLSYYFQPLPKTKRQKVLQTMALPVYSILCYFSFSLLPNAWINVVRYLLFNHCLKLTGKYSKFFKLRHCQCNILSYLVSPLPNTWISVEPVQSLPETNRNTGCGQ